MIKKKIESREDVSLLVNTFYSKVRKDALLGPIFNGIITDWETHLKLLTDFWETNLFFKRKYFGNPLHAHIEVDKKVGHTINELHFGTWINLWIETVDELFEGETAQIAINRARNMGTFIHLNIFNARNKDAKKPE
ncbi:group III truncated hemoglobin [Aequorivita lipolytica]|uniref:Group III truncated hemoglobin n=1 Tax=Aequorivita lipolytica TaxID=153267 RepID=A0A5C6YMN2_9FLAO|nr:group III truncated hemoglobin [Aequorivita lipolytica]TXD68522.1 group III truncated hemoglobin [Aequorivita lipolytica]SRX53333.1 Group 3 truncated hemoglobin ctb [Aequorivita lipolytica]